MGNGRYIILKVLNIKIIWRQCAFNECEGGIVHGRQSSKYTGTNIHKRCNDAK